MINLKTEVKNLSVSRIFAEKRKDVDKALVKLNKKCARLGVSEPTLLIQMYMSTVSQMVHMKMIHLLLLNYVISGTQLMFLILVLLYLKKSNLVIGKLLLILSILKNNIFSLILMLIMNMILNLQFTIEIVSILRIGTTVKR